MAKSWERPWSIEEIVENAPKWTLAGDAALLKHLEDFSEKLFAKAEDTNDNLNKLLDDLNESSIKLDLVKNEFLGLQNTQFIESRVYEDDETLETAKEETVEKKGNENDTKEAMKHAVLEGLDILDKYYDRISVPASDSEDEEAESYVLRMKDPYINRPLPYLIGSKEWHDKWHVGLVASSSEDEEEQVEEKYSDTDSESNLPVTDRRTISTSDSGTDISNRVEKPVASSTFNDTLASTDSEEYNNSVPSKPPISNLSFAEQLAARLGNVAAKEEDPVTVNRNPIQKPKVQTRIMGDILSDEPPPIDDLEDGLFSGKSGQGMFSGGDGLFDDTDDETDYFSGKKLPSKSTKVEEGKTSNLFDDAEKDGMFTQKADEKPNKPKITNRGLFSDEESDDDLFSTSNYRPSPSYIKSTASTIPFIPDEPPELIPKAKHQDTSRNAQSAQSNVSEVSEKSSTSNAESGDLEADNKLLINTKQKPRKIGLFDDPGDLFKDDLFSDAGLFSTTSSQKEVKQKKKLKLFDDEDDDIFASENKNSNDIFSGNKNSRKNVFGSSEGRDIFNSKPNKEVIPDTLISKDKDSNNFLSSDRKTEGLNNKSDETSNSKLFGSDEDLFESNSLFNSTAQDNIKSDDISYSDSGRLFKPSDADLFSNIKGGLFDSSPKTNLFDTLKNSNDEKSSKINQEKTIASSSYQDQVYASSATSTSVANVSTSPETSKLDRVSSSPKTSSNSEELLPSNKSQKETSSKARGLFTSTESRSMFDDDDDGWDKPPPLESSKKSSSRSLFDEDSSDDDLFSSKPPLKKLLEKKTSQNQAKLEEDRVTSQDGSVTTLEASQENLGESRGKLEDNTLKEVENFSKTKVENLVETLGVVKKVENSQGSENIQQNKEKSDFDNKLILEKDEDKISDDQILRKPPIISKKPEMNKSYPKECGTTVETEKPEEPKSSKDTTVETKKPVIQLEKPAIASSKPVTNLMKKSVDSPKEIDGLINSAPANKNSGLKEIRESVPSFSLFNDSPPDIDWDTKSETNLFDDEDMFDDIPVSSQKALIFDREPPVLDYHDKTKRSLFDDDDDGVPSANRIMNLFDDEPPSLDFMVKSPKKNVPFHEEPPASDIIGKPSISSGDVSGSFESERNQEDKPDLKSGKLFPDEADFKGSSFYDTQTRSKGDTLNMLKETGKNQEDLFVKPKSMTEKPKMDAKKFDFLKDPDEVPEKKRVDSPGKIKHNLNINVNALMPGASLPRKIDTASTLSKSRSLEEKQESVEGENVVSIQHTQSCKDVRVIQVEQINKDGDVETLHSITKNRARIQTKRKPSTRRARQASIKKKQEDNNSNTEDVNKNSSTDTILDNAGFSTQNNNLDDTLTINTKNQNQRDNNNSIKSESNIIPKEKQKAADVDQTVNTSLFDDPKPLLQKQIAKSANVSKNSSLFDDGGSDSDIFTDKKQAVKGKSKLSLFGDVDDVDDLFSERETRKLEHDGMEGIFKDDVDIFSHKKVTVKKGSLFEDLSGDEDIFGSGTTQKNTGKSIGNSAKKLIRNRNLLKKSEECRVTHDPLDAMSNNFNE